MEMKEITLYLNKELVNDIDSIVYFLNSTENKDVKHTFETFVIGTIIEKVKELKHYNDLAGTITNDKPYKLKNMFKEIAEELQLTQKEVANQTGINTTTLNLIFQNKHQPSLDNFFKLWVVMGYPPFKECLYKEDE